MAPRPPGVSAVPVAASVIKAYWRSGDELPPEGVEGCFGLLWQWSSLVSGVLPGEFEQGSRDDGEVLDVGPEEVAKAHE